MKHNGFMRVFCAAALSAAFVGALCAVEVDSLAARVGTETILKSEIFHEMQRMNAPASAYADVRAEMIDRKLILRAAREAKMTMQEWVIENRIREIIKNGFGGDRNKLMEALAQRKMPYLEWHSRMKEDMIIQAMRWNIVDKNVSAGPLAMRKEYEEHPERYSEPSKVTVSVILLKPEDSAKRDVISAALKEESFSDLAKRYSADARASEGGVWKDVDPTEVFKSAIADEIAKMPRGTISRWIELDGWSFLLRKDAETPGRKLSFTEAYSAIENNVRHQASEKAYVAWIERLRADTYIKIY